ncbi:MAG: pyridoxamine 5'-phosphate oxidase family protein [Planctomycetaceae bacterium]|jgi:uncharacterized pyridoxamine 5'-phosphate oxidase family protein|nr:pyridoxamine 5'-phosphate oxidase family protein [Planctomycetaceae bacterium]
MIKDVIDFLMRTSDTFLATSINNVPKVRPMVVFPIDENGIIWFFTGKNKNLWKELNVNPLIEFSTYDGELKWIRVSGEVKLIDNLEVKTIIFNLLPNIRGIYSSPSDPNFATFCLEHWTATIYNFALPPMTYNC